MTFTLQHKSPDYSAVYIIFKTDGETGVEGHGLTFTLGRGNELGNLILIHVVANNCLSCKLEVVFLRHPGASTICSQLLRWILLYCWHILTTLISHMEGRKQVSVTLIKRWKERWEGQGRAELTSAKNPHT